MVDTNNTVIFISPKTSALKITKNVIASLKKVSEVLKIDTEKLSFLEGIVEENESDLILDRELMVIINVALMAFIDNFFTKDLQFGECVHEVEIKNITKSFNSIINVMFNNIK